MPTSATASTTSGAAPAATPRVGTTPAGVGIGEERRSTSPTGTGSSSGSGVGTASRSQNPNEIPVGTEFDVRLANTLSSKTSQVEDRFEATTMVDLRDERDRVLVPAGSTMRGVVSSVNKATRMDRKGSMTVSFDRVTINGRAYPMRATVTQALESEGIMGEKEKIGIGAGVGAVLGAILGGGKGALAGILIGGGGTIAATEGKDVELPPGRSFGSGWIRLSRWGSKHVVARRLQPGTAARQARATRPLDLRATVLPLATSFIASLATRIVLSTSLAVCAPERNHASNCEGGG